MMKKCLFALFLCLLTLTTLTACGGGDDYSVLNKAYEQYNLTGITNVKNNLSLPSTFDVDGSTEVTITWKSSNEYVLKSNGVINRLAESDCQVILTATFGHGGLTLDKNFIVTVKQAEAPLVASTINQVLNSVATGDKVKLENVVVVASMESGYVVSDNANSIFIHKYNATVQTGDKVTLEGTKAVYFNMPQIAETSVSIVGEGTSTLESTKVTADEYAALSSTSMSSYGFFTITGTLVKEDDGSFTIEGDTKTVSIYYKCTTTVLEDFIGQEVEIDVYTYSYYDSQNQWRVIFDNNTSNVRLA